MLQSLDSPQDLRHDWGIDDARALYELPFSDLLYCAQAARLKARGLDYYNHNLDTSPEFYGEVISTRTYKDRLETPNSIFYGERLLTAGNAPADRDRGLFRRLGLRPLAPGAPGQATQA